MWTRYDDSCACIGARWNTVRRHHLDELRKRTGGKALRSTDNGQTWTSLHEGLPEAPVWSFLFAGSGRMFLSTLGVYASTDNGTTWISANPGLPNTSVYSLASSAATPSLRGPGRAEYFGYRSHMSPPWRDRLLPGLFNASCSRTIPTRSTPQRRSASASLKGRR